MKPLYCTIARILALPGLQDKGLRKQVVTAMRTRDAYARITEATGTGCDEDKNPRASLHLSGELLIVPETVFEVRSVSELVF
jgi:hypothetical protein